MSLNKFTGDALDPETKKEWMNINCNVVNGTEMYVNYVPLIPIPPYQLYTSIEPVAAANQNTINLTGTFIGTQTIPLNQLYPGKTIHLFASGKEELENGNPTGQLQIYVSNLTNSIQYGNQILKQGESNGLHIWTLDVFLVIKSITNNIASIVSIYRYITDEFIPTPIVSSIKMTNGLTDINVANGLDVVLWGAVDSAQPAVLEPIIINVSVLY